MRVMRIVNLLEGARDGLFSWFRSDYSTITTSTATMAAAFTISGGMLHGSPAMVGFGVAAVVGIVGLCEVGRRAWVRRSDDGLSERAALSLSRQRLLGELADAHRNASEAGRFDEEMRALAKAALLDAASLRRRLADEKRAHAAEVRRLRGEPTSVHAMSRSRRADKARLRSLSSRSAGDPAPAPAGSASRDGPVDDGADCSMVRIVGRRVSTRIGDPAGRTHKRLGHGTAR